MSELYFFAFSLFITEDETRNVPKKRNKRRIFPGDRLAPKAKRQQGKGRPRLEYALPGNWNVYACCVILLREVRVRTVWKHYPVTSDASVHIETVASGENRSFELLVME